MADMEASAEVILHYFAEEPTESSCLPMAAQESPPSSPLPQNPIHVSKPGQTSIPTSVIQSCVRSTSIGESSTSSSYSYEASGEESDDEQVTRKRTRDTPVGESASRSKVVRKTEEQKFPDHVVRVTPLRPICSVYMVSYGQEDSIDQHAGRTANVIQEPFEGLLIDRKKILHPDPMSWTPSMVQRRRRRELEGFIFTERFKTVWHSIFEQPNGEVIRMTVPFTVDVSDIFNSFTMTTVPQNIKIGAFRYALKRAEQLSEFKRIFSLNDPNEGCQSLQYVDLTKYDTSESRIVWGGRPNTQPGNPNSA